MVDIDDGVAVASADSSKIGIQMLGFDARYTNGPIQARAQYILADLERSRFQLRYLRGNLGPVMMSCTYEGGYNL